MPDSLNSIVFNVTISIVFALLLRSANQACTKCCLEVTTVTWAANVSWVARVSSSPSQGRGEPYQGVLGGGGEV